MIARQLRDLTSKVTQMRPVELIQYIEEQFNFKNRYLQDKQEYLREFKALYKKYCWLYKVKTRHCPKPHLRITPIASDFIYSKI